MKITIYLALLPSDVFFVYSYILEPKKIQKEHVRALAQVHYAGERLFSTRLVVESLFIYNYVLSGRNLDRIIVRGHAR